MALGADDWLEDWRIGLIGGYSQSHFSAPGRVSTGESDNYQFGLYGGTQRDNFSIQTGASYSRHAVSTTRTIAIPGLTDTLTADFDAGTFQAFGEVGYDIDLGDTGLHPFADLTYVNFAHDGFAEQSGPTALSGAAVAGNVGFTTLGLRAEHDLWLGIPRCQHQWHGGMATCVGDTAPASTHSFANGAGFAINGVSAAQDKAIVEASLDLPFTPQTTLGVSYSGAFSTASQDHAVSAKLGLSY